MSKPILCCDFDGVLHSYSSGWKGAAVIPDPPVKGMVSFLHRAIKEFDVQIFSSRSGQTGGIEAMKTWLTMHVTRHYDCENHGGASREVERAYAILDAVSFPTEKPPAMVTIDDRAIQFRGEWPTIAWLKAFQPWYKQPFGATGKYSMPALNDDDEGELQMGVAYDDVNGLVRLDFGKPVAWLALPPPEAMELAKLLLRKAGAKTIEITV